MQSAPPCTETGCSTETADLYRSPKTRNHEGGFFATWYLRSSTKVLLAVVARRKRTSCGDALAGGAIMRVVTEILSGRRDQFSSVEVDRGIGVGEATHEHILLRRYAVRTGGGDALAECKQLLVPTHRANRQRFVKRFASCNFCVNPVAPTQRSCNSVGCPPYEKPSYPA